MWLALVTLKTYLSLIFYYFQSQATKYKSFATHRTIIWLGEEIYQVNCEQNILLVEQGDFISKGFELIPGLFSKTAGLVSFIKKNDVIKNILIKSGLIYEAKRFKNQSQSQTLYYLVQKHFKNVKR